VPIKIPRDLPAYEALTAENVFVMTKERAERQDIRPLRVAIANLMPTTVATETQLLRLLGNTPLQIDITLLRMGSHESKNAPPGHLDKFYLDAKELLALGTRFDGLVITGAPVETLPFEEVDYWQELVSVLEYSKHNVFSTLHICWGAQAGLYHHYRIPKRPLPAKLSGVFPHRLLEKHSPLFRGFDDVFYAPQSRYTESEREAISACTSLKVRAETPCAGPFIITARAYREIYVTGHLEYDPLTLDSEYRRDKERGLNPDIPCNYYRGDDPARPPIVRWRSHAHLFFSNWLNYVYQETPYDLAEME